MPEPRSPYRDWQRTDLRREYAYSRPGVHTAYKDYSVPEKRAARWPWVVGFVIIAALAFWGVKL